MMPIFCRRPISISSIDKVKKQCHLIYRIEGAGTAIFSSLSQGDTLDVMGPQGNGFDLSDLDESETGSPCWWWDWCSALA